jgi:hypothetical protein
MTSDYGVGLVDGIIICEHRMICLGVQFQIIWLDRGNIELGEYGIALAEKKQTRMNQSSVHNTPQNKEAFHYRRNFEIEEELHNRPLKVTSYVNNLPKTCLELQVHGHSKICALSSCCIYSSNRKTLS